MTLNDTDLFIVDRDETNYKVDFNNLKQYIPGIPSGSRCMFFMNSAPYGWVLDSTNKTSEATVRILSGSGGGSGGGENFLSVFKNWTTSVPTHNHGVSAGTHKHSGSVTHGHGISDPGHSHGITYRKSTLDPDNPPGDADGITNFEIVYDETDTSNAITMGEELGTFLDEAYPVIYESEFIDNSQVAWTSLVAEALNYNSTRGFLAVFRGLADFADGVITQADLNTIVTDEVTRIGEISDQDEITGPVDEVLTYGIRAGCAAVLSSYSVAGNTNTMSFNNGAGHSFSIVGGGGTNGWQTVNVAIDSSTTYNYTLTTSGAINPKVRHFNCENCDPTIPGEQSGTTGNTMRFEDGPDNSFDDLVVKTSMGTFVKTGLRTGIYKPNEGSSPCLQDPQPAKTNVTINAANPGVSFGSSKASGLSTTNSTGNVGNNLDFTVKYHKGILCQKDVY